MNAYVRSILVITALIIATTAANTRAFILVSGNGPIGTLDPNTIVSTNNGASFYSAYINSPIGLYSTMPGANWIGVQPDGYGPDLTTNIYRTTFTMPAGFTTPGLFLSILADDQAVVFLNGSFIGAQPFPHVNYTNPPAVFIATNSAFFLPA